MFVSRENLIVKERTGRIDRCAVMGHLLIHDYTCISNALLHRTHTHWQLIADKTVFHSQIPSETINHFSILSKSNWREDMCWNTTRNAFQRAAKKSTRSWRFHVNWRSSWCTGCCSASIRFYSSTHFCRFDICWPCGHWCGVQLPHALDCDDGGSVCWHRPKYAIC